MDVVAGNEMVIDYLAISRKSPHAKRLDDISRIVTEMKMSGEIHRYIENIQKVAISSNRCGSAGDGLAQGVKSQNCQNNWLKMHFSGTKLPLRENQRNSGGSLPDELFCRCLWTRCLI